MTLPLPHRLVAHARALSTGERPPTDLGPPTLFDELVAGLQLDPLDRAIVALTVGAALDPGVADAILARTGERALTIGAAGQLLAALYEVTPAEVVLRGVGDGRLRRSGLVDLAGGGAPVRAPLLPSRRLLGLVQDRMELHPHVAEVAALIATDRDAAIGVALLPPIEELAELCAALQAQRRGRGPVAIVGEARTGRLRVALAIAARLGRRRALVVDAALVAPDPVTWRGLATALIADGAFHLAPVVIREPGAAGLAAAERIAQGGVACFVTAPEEPPDGRCRIHARVVRPDEPQRLAAWRAETAGQPWADDDSLTRLARATVLARSDIAVAAGMAATPPASGPIEAWVERTTHSQLRSRLDRFAQLVTRRVRLDELVVGDELAAQLRELVRALRVRPQLAERWPLARALDGLGGVATLFDGPPGTGKSMSAAVIATELDVPLYRIDVATIVDRYVGETEKNLQRLFREAAVSRGVLLFDEADSLFSRRVETKDAMDRFANMQVNQLLTLIEEFPGVSILTTNLKQGLDVAFARRFAYKLQFALPELDERIALWRMYLPPGHLRDDEVQALASRYDRVSGADVRNAVVRAASATFATGRLGVDDLRRALVAELQAGGSVVSSSL
ncbi:MAG: AAA family ATPase [Myxococcales bacterium]|nr:AAA family ATPase [Myxococcales bacterium]